MPIDIHLKDLLIRMKSIGKRTPVLIIFFILFFVQSFIPTSLFAQLSFSYSYFNLTRNNGGGSPEKGDTLEIHALGYVSTGATVSNIYFTDSIRAGTQYVPNSMKLVTNEGVILKTFSDVSGSDAGVYDPSPTPRIRINFGTSAGGGVALSGAGFMNTTGGGTINGGDVPIAGSGTLGIVAYKIVITGNYGDTLHLGGNFYYNLWKNGKAAKNDKKYHFDPVNVKVVANQGFCPDFSSASFTAESSFGAGKAQNRTQGITSPGYLKVLISTGKPNDNYYAIVNNTSGTGSTDNTVPYKVSGSPRVFGAWDIVGDHTNAVDQNLGNSPVPPGTLGGYMLVMNADYNTGEAYSDIIQNVCPNTYYEFSAWIRNLCGQCGADKNGNAYPAPSHGVKPNLTYTINGVDYYTTGNIDYSGTWVKRGFIYKTGPAETQFTIAIKNNASGGDGNDWVLDDINLATCYPNLIMNPNDTASACAGFPITITDTVKSYYNNYGNYRWEVSKDGGTTWIPIGGTGSKTPVLVNGLFQYHVDTVITPVAADSGFYFRIKVATTSANLTNNDCSVDNSQKVFLKVYSSSCSVLDTKIENISGKTINKKNVINWEIEGGEKNIKEYIIEKSTDGIHFSKAGIVTSDDNKLGKYTFTDPENISAINYYRLKIVSNNQTPPNYSKTILVYNGSSSVFKISTVNPFHDNVKTEVSLPAQGKVEINLFDMYGKSLHKKTLQLSKGNSQVILDNVSNLPAGMYILTALYNGIMIQNKLVKNN